MIGCNVACGTIGDPAHVFNIGRRRDRVHVDGFGGGEDGPTSGDGSGDSREEGIGSVDSRLADCERMILHSVDSVATGTGLLSFLNNRCIEAVLNVTKPD